MDRAACRILFIVLAALALALGWQGYLIDYDWDPCGYVVAIRDGKWFVDLGYGRIGYLFLLRPVRWILSATPGGATFESTYGALKILHLLFSVALIGLWYGVASSLFGEKTAAIGSPLFLLNIPFLTNTTRIWTETPMLMGIIAALWIWVVCVWKCEDRARRAKGFAGIAAILAVCLLVREIAVFFLPAFVLPLLATRGRRREGALATAGLLAVVGAVVLLYRGLRLLSPAYDQAVANIETLFPTVSAPSEVAHRAALVARELMRDYAIVTLLSLISLARLVWRREWPMTLLCASVSIAPLTWIVFRGGDFYGRYVIPAAPGLALACLPLFAHLEIRRAVRRQVLVAVALVAGLAFTNDWKVVFDLKDRARMTRHFTRRWAEQAAAIQGNSVWLVGSLTGLMDGFFAEPPLKGHCFLYWPWWSGRYENLLPTLAADLQGGKTIFVCRDRDKYSAAQWETVESLDREFQRIPFDSKTSLFELRICPLPAAAVTVGFAGETTSSLLVSGFDYIEHWGTGTSAVWAIREKAVIAFPPDRLPRLADNDTAIEARMNWFCLDRPGSPSVNGTLDVEFDTHRESIPFSFPPGGNKLVVRVPRRETPDVSLRLTFRFASLWIPAEVLPDSRDKRTLAAALVGVTLIPLSEELP